MYTYVCVFFFYFVSACVHDALTMPLMSQTNSVQIPETATRYERPIFMCTFHVMPPAMSYTCPTVIMEPIRRSCIQLNMFNFFFYFDLKIFCRFTYYSTSGLVRRCHHAYNLQDNNYPSRNVRH